jgi:hypothetical protein
MKKGCFSEKVEVRTKGGILNVMAIMINPEKCQIFG